MPFKKFKVRNDLKTLVIESPMDSNVYYADKILPTISVKDKSSDYPTLPTGVGMKKLDLKKAPGGSFKRTDWVEGGGTYQTYQYGMEEALEDIDVLEKSEIYDEEKVASQIVLSDLKIGREFRVANAVFNTTTFADATEQMAVSNLWTNTSSATPWEDIDNAFKISKAKNGRIKSQLSLILPEADFRAIMRSDEVRSDVKYTKDISSMKESAKASFLSDFFGIKEILIVATSYDTTPEGTAEADFSEIWTPEFAMLGYLSPASPSWKVPGLGRQPVWKKFARDFKMESYDENQSASRIIRAREYRGETVNPLFGVLLTGLHS